MAMMDAAAWNGADQTMHPGSEDDFQQFLDMNNMGPLAEGLQFDFQDFQNADGGPITHPPSHRDVIDTAMTGTEQPLIISSTSLGVHSQMTPMTSAPSLPTASTTMIPPPTPTDAISDIDAQIQYLQQQRLQQQQRQLDEQQAAYFVQHSRMVPPTPQSLELAAGNGAHYYAPPSDQSHQQQGIYDQYQRLKEQQELAFTPLVSPAVTPLDSQFPIDTQFTVPGAYFSPLTSPALHAQNDPIPMYDQRLSGGSASSPAEAGLEAGAAMASGSATASKDLAKKVRKPSAAKARGKTNVRQSPIAKPQRRKTGSTPILNAQVLSELAEEQQRLADKRPAEQASANQPITHTHGTSAIEATDSEDASVSPEALSEMPPPPVPKPRSARPSPSIKPQKGQAAALPAAHQPTPGKPSPATPASLMKLPSPSRSNPDAAMGAPEAIAVEQIEKFELPESANFPKSRSQPTPKTTPAMTPTAVQSPTEAAMISGMFQPLPSPGFAKPTTAAASATQSPQLTPGPSSARKTPQLAPKGSKKRSSVGSVQVSPALRPRISPNIKPLLPGGTTADDTASQLLASKSNYQNLLEGNKVPGVSYPSELSTNLTSKRTSHKIAEQGRRNRINSALQEIATLLPRPAPQESRESDGEGEGQKDGKAAALLSSKASTVELAIEYIKQLKREAAEATKRAELAEMKLEGLS